MKLAMIRTLVLVSVMISAVGCKITSKIAPTDFVGGMGSGNSGSGTSGSTNGSGSVGVIAPEGLKLSAAPQPFSSYVASLIRQAGLSNQTAINNIYTIYNAQKNQLPQRGESSEINAAAMAAAFVVAGQVCGALRDQEAALADGAARKVFRGVNFAPAATVTDRNALVDNDAIRMSGDALTRMFLGRAATTAEQTMFIQAKDEALLGETISSANNRKLVNDIAVTICTGVASSLEALTM